MITNSEQGRALGKRSGVARQKLTPERIEAELPPLDSPANIRAAYQTVQRWVALGLVAGSHANALVRACDGALKLLDTTVDLRLIAQLEKRVKELEAELAAARRAAGATR